MAAREVVIRMVPGRRSGTRGWSSFWTILTLGIYTMVWYYRINREVRDFGRAHGDEKLANSNPVLSILAVTIRRAADRAPDRLLLENDRPDPADAAALQRALLEGWIIAVLYVLGVFIILTLPAIPAIVRQPEQRLEALSARRGQRGRADRGPAPQAADRIA